MARPEHIGTWAAKQKDGRKSGIGLRPSPGGNAMAVPFDQRPDLIWFDGKLVPTGESQVSVLTHGLP